MTSTAAIAQTTPSIDIRKIVLSFLTQDYIAQETPYVDVIAKKYPNEFKTTTGKEARIDYVYCTQPFV